jgi:hypothetical protein
MLVQQAARQAALELEAASAAADESPESADPTAEAPAGAAAEATAGAPAEPGASPAADPEAPVVPVQVEVTSLPRGADVLVGDKRVGMSPLRVELPLGRPADVTVRSAGFAPQTRTITASSDHGPERFKLEPLDYLLFVRTEPPGAELEIGGKSATAPGPLALGHLDGSVLVTVSKAGHQRMTRPVRLEEFSEREGTMRAEIDVRLSPLPGYPKAVPSPPASKAHAKPTRKAPPAKQEDAPPAPAAQDAPSPEPAPAAPAAPAGASLAVTPSPPDPAAPSAPAPVAPPPPPPSVLPPSP